ncbi:MAG: heat-inducible transcriptional repressor HrcA [Bacilli bacterium]|jgi:heat-inducible transcriptional repressor|nr:heat-inducible transcriptional repressor HrcA [Bacilli bacterium]
MLSKRQKDILKIIVEHYIKLVRPVSSNNICKLLNCSSATIRNEMVTLENLGFIEKMHTSSGRVPSEKGYRYYVDYLMEPKAMTGEDMLKLQTIFHNQSLPVNDVIAKSMTIISELTNYTAIVLGSSAQENRLQQVEIVPLDKEAVIAIVITDKGHVEHKRIEVPNVSLDEVKKTVELINNLVVGTPISKVSSKLEFEIKPIISKYVKQHEILYQAFYQAFNDFSHKNSMQLSGKVNFLKQPEFDNVDKIRDIITKLEDDELVRSVKAEDSDIKVYIGSENEFDEDVTIIKTKYTIDDESGTIAIIGPKRMEYNRVVSLLEYLKENIKR